MNALLIALVVGVVLHKHVYLEIKQDQLLQTNAMVLHGFGDQLLVQIVPPTLIARVACTWTKIVLGVPPITRVLNGELN